MTTTAHRSLIPLPSRITGERVIVRPYARGDGANVFDAIACSREALDAWLPWPVRHQCVDDSEDYARRILARWITREDLAVALTDLDGRIVGGSGLHNIDWDVRVFEIGYWLRADAWGRGYVTEAARLLTALAFGRLDARRVLIRCDARNARSAAVPARLGFAQEARLRACRLAVDGSGPTDTLEYGLTRDDLPTLAWYPDALARVMAAPLDG
jgi:RimJ/RimL family protein N-acetyltransferase